MCGLAWSFYLITGLLLLLRLLPLLLIPESVKIPPSPLPSPVGSRSLIIRYVLLPLLVHPS
jgi:hypothetical protein